MIYGYVRVSSNTQNIARQMEAMKILGVGLNKIFIDYLTGKNFKRDNYLKLRKKLKEGDVLYVESVDRLGRNYEMIRDEWAYITKKINADIVVIDMPVLDTRVTPNNLCGRVISEIFLLILSFVAEYEKDLIGQRQAEGIRIAKQNGVQFGRKPIQLPENFEKIVAMHKAKEITLNETLKILNISRATFYKYAKIILEKSLDNE